MAPQGYGETSLGFDQAICWQVRQSKAESRVDRRLQIGLYIGKRAAGLAVPIVGQPVAPATVAGPAITLVGVTIVP